MRQPTFAFDVPLDDHEAPTVWLAEDGRPITADEVELLTAEAAADAEEATADADEVAVVQPTRRPLRLVFRLFPTGRDDMAIQLRLDEVNGGIGGTVDLQRGISRQRTGILAALTRRLWPDGKPKATTNQDKEAQGRQLAEAFVRIGMDPIEPDDVEAVQLEKAKIAFDRMSGLRDRQEATACWPVMIVNSPPGWEDIYTIPLMPAHRDAILAAYMRARSEAEVEAGK